MALLMLLACSSSLTAQHLQNTNFENGTQWWFPFGSCEIAPTDEGRLDDSGVVVSNRSLFWMGIAQDITGLVADEDYHIQVWVRSLDGPTNLRLQIRQVDDRGERFITAGDFDVDEQWTRVQGGFRYQENGTVETLQLIVNNQSPSGNVVSYAIDDVSFELNDWRAAADERIATYRKRPASISLKNPDGSPASGFDVDIQQVGHHFAFGSALNEVVSENDVYHDFFIEHFDWATVEWRMQWPIVESVQGVEDYTHADLAVSFAKEHAIPLRGHAVFWPNPNFVPSWLADLEPEQCLEEIDQRLQSVVPRFVDDLVSWDVCNEMLDFSFFSDKLGPEIRPYFFQQTREFAPEVPLFANEGLATFKSEQKAVRYRQLVESLESDGAEVNGIGLQTHFFESNVSAKALEISLAQLEPLGKKIMLSEFDIVNPDSNERGKGLVDFYRYAFSRPEIDGVIMWGFWAGTHWLGPDASIVDEDWTVNAAGQAYFDLIENWTTATESNITTEEETVDFTGFNGTYIVTLTDQSTGEKSFHWLQLTQDASQQTQEITLVHGSPNSLTFYGRPEDDEFHVDFDQLDRVTVNGRVRKIKQLAEIDRIIFRGMEGEDEVSITGSNDQSAGYTFNNGVLSSNVDSQIDLEFVGMEVIEFTVTSENNTIRLYDSPLADTFESHSTSASLSNELTRFTARDFNAVFAFATAEENTDTDDNTDTDTTDTDTNADTAIFFDSPANDAVFANHDFVRIRDGLTNVVRRADRFENVEFRSLQGNDRLRLELNTDPRTIQIAPDVIEIATANGVHQFHSFRFATFNALGDNNDTLHFVDSESNDFFLGEPGRFRFFGPGYTYSAFGFKSADFHSLNGGSDRATIRDSFGDDVVTVNSSVVDWQGLDFSVTLDGVPLVIANAKNGGNNTVEINNAEIDFRQFGNLDDD